jgi:hypothetical protein
MTPTTTRGFRLIVTVLPMTERSSPYSRCHVSWDSTTAGAADGESSLGVSVRPNSGRTPSTPKISPTVVTAWNDSGSPGPTTVASDVENAANWLAARVSRRRSMKLAGDEPYTDGGCAAE